MEPRVAAAFLRPGRLDGGGTPSCAFASLSLASPALGRALRGLLALGTGALRALRGLALRGLALRGLAFRGLAFRGLARFAPFFPFFFFGEPRFGAFLGGDRSAFAFSRSATSGSISGRRAVGGLIGSSSSPLTRSSIIHSLRDCALRAAHVNGWPVGP